MDEMPDEPDWDEIEAMEAEAMEAESYAGGGGGLYDEQAAQQEEPEAAAVLSSSARADVMHFSPVRASLQSARMRTAATHSWLAGAVQAGGGGRRGGGRRLRFRGRAGLRRRWDPAEEGGRAGPLRGRRLADADWCAHSAGVLPPLPCRTRRAITRSSRWADSAATSSEPRP